ncbi:MAG: hypothetical protein SV186_05860 [Candidatus Nanohaloarchaea archaeon]|nr:hypothetical protein [Candidatus Nanohaloarchaea archaeon]
MGIVERVFSDEDWRDHLDPEIARKMEKLLKRIKPFEDSYKKSKHESIAQLWVALAEVYIQVDRMNQRLIHIERLLSEIHEKEAREMQDDQLSDSLKQY